MDIFELIRNRHSFRGMYLPDPVPREHLRIIMEAGLEGPSGCNKQTTSLVGVDDPVLMKKLGDALKIEHFASSPAAICVLTQPIMAFRQTCYSVQDYSAAIQNMLLCIVALGYESCWVEGEVTADPEVNRDMSAILGLTDGYEIVAYLPIGKTAQPPAPPKKKPFAERAWFNGFKN